MRSEITAIKWCARVPSISAFHSIFSVWHAFNSAAEMCHHHVVQVADSQATTTPWTISAPPSEAVRSSLAFIDMRFCSCLVSVDGLEHCQRLREVHISGTSVKNVSPLSRLPSVECVRIDHMRSDVDISVFSECASLKELDFRLSNVHGRDALINRRPSLKPSDELSYHVFCALARDLLEDCPSSLKAETITRLQLMARYHPSIIAPAVLTCGNAMHNIAKALSSPGSCIHSEALYLFCVAFKDGAPLDDSLCHIRKQMPDVVAVLLRFICDSSIQTTSHQFTLALSALYSISNSPSILACVALADARCMLAAMHACISEGRYNGFAPSFMTIVCNIADKFHSNLTEDDDASLEKCVILSAGKLRATASSFGANAGPTQEAAIRLVEKVFEMSLLKTSTIESLMQPMAEALAFGQMIDMNVRQNAARVLDSMVKRIASERWGNIPLGFLPTLLMLQPTMQTEFTMFHVINILFYAACCPAASSGELSLICGNLGAWMKVNGSVGKYASAALAWIGNLSFTGAL